jgi:hypothetical protein
MSLFFHHAKTPTIMPSYRDLFTPFISANPNRVLLMVTTERLLPSDEIELYDTLIISGTLLCQSFTPSQARHSPYSLELPAA